MRCDGIGSDSYPTKPDCVDKTVLKFVLNVDSKITATGERGLGKNLH
jgi:hypothetical protein